MKIIAISDTHGLHGQLNLPEGDVLIHAGDLSNRGRENEVRNFLDWFSAQPHRHKIFIAGNHDFFFDKASKQEINAMIPSNLIYLNDSGCTIDGIKFWGSPIQPWFHDWAFNRQRGEDIRKHWDLIPTDTDVLITHGPAAGILDRLIFGTAVGCEDLLTRINVVKPKVHICGHIHEAYGEVQRDGIRFINASILNEDYFITNDPIEFEI